MNQHILIVEDEQKIARLLEDFLAAEGFIVHLHSDGASATKVALELDPTLIILDVMLPGKDGFVHLPGAAPAIHRTHHHADCQGR